MKHKNQEKREGMAFNRAWEDARAGQPRAEKPSEPVNQNQGAKNEGRPSDLEALLDERTADLQRLRADFENYRKQTEQQKTHAVEMASRGTVLKLLPLLDDLDRAFLTYVELSPLLKSLEKTLKELKLQKIDTAPGVEFNPDLHDAVMVEGDGEAEKIAETLRPGYYYEGEVLRPAMVKVVRE